MKPYILVIGIFICLFARSQYSNLSIKEQFDILNIIEIQQYNPLNSSIGDDGSKFGDGMSHILDGYITMYKTTLDKGYLNKFVLQSLGMMNNRHDIAYDLNGVLNDDLTGIDDVPRWAAYTYQDGYILGSLADFVHFIKIEQPALQTETLYQFSDIQNNPFGANFNTYGDYANWLGQRINESLFWFINNGYWDDNFAMKDSPEDDYALPINKQVGFARAFLFMGLAENYQLSINKAMKMAYLYKSQIEFTDLCGTNQIYNAKLLRQKPNNSYWWYHAGWEIYNRNCFLQFNIPEYEKYVEFIEDMSHGAVTMYVPLEYYNYQPSTPFTQVDMLRFRNTFVKNLYDGNGGFYNSVKGVDNPVDACTEDCPHNYFASSCLAYMPYEKFDSPSLMSNVKGVYEIIMDYYVGNLANLSSVPNYCCGMNKGHAETVQAQWKRECVNLTVYNRDVVYSQDFFVKNNLTIDPSAGPGLSYADPIINTPTFTVEPTISSEIKAGNSVHLKPGVHFKSGSEIHAFIDEDLCKKNQINGETGTSAIVQEGVNEAEFFETIAKDEETNTMSIQSLEIEKFKISPNPFSGSTTINFNLIEFAEMKIVLEDLTGKMVAVIKEEDLMEQGFHSITFQDQKLEGGVYYCSFYRNGQFIFKKKLIKY